MFGQTAAQGCRTRGRYLGFLQVDMHLVAQVGSRQARGCSLVAVEDHSQAVGKHIQPVIGVARARPKQTVKTAGTQHKLAYHTLMHNPDKPFQCGQAVHCEAFDA